MDTHMIMGINEKGNSEKKKIGIIAALEVEVYTLKKNLKDMKITRTAGTDYYTGTIGDYFVILMQCGMGKVSAALGAQALITEFHPDYVINTGCAGALAGDLAIGDIVLSTVTVEWDIDTIAIGNPRGYVSAMDAVEMHADEKLLEMIAAAIPENVTVRKGMVCSGDQFVSTDEQRHIILSAFPDALCAEMEGAAIGHVCAQNNIPFCVVRCMSDTADGNSGVDFAAFSAEAGVKSANIILTMLTGEASK